MLAMALSTTIPLSRAIFPYKYFFATELLDNGCFDQSAIHGRLANIYFSTIRNQ
jgi:hypothetical protein